MTVRSCLLASWLSCVAANVAVLPATAQDNLPSEPRRINIDSPNAEANANQQMADAVANALNRNGQLKGYHIDVVVVGAVAELNGRVHDAGQRDLANQITRSIPGIQHVRDRLAYGSIEVAAAQNVASAAPAVIDNAPPFGTTVPAPFPPAPAQVNPNVGPIMPIPNSTGAPEPTPVFHSPVGMMPNPQYQPPPMPPYAWPAYAPYNNYSRVAQPKTHPYGQWPFIGPMYPYPKVPLGWRRITLEWQDGSWYYGREATSHDWWRIRYW